MGGGGNCYQEAVCCCDKSDHVVLRPLELVCGMNVEEFGPPEGANSLERETA